MEEKRLEQKKAEEASNTLNKNLGASMASIALRAEDDEPEKK